MTSSPEQVHAAAAQTRWRNVGTRDARSLSRARWLMHNMIQWPTRIANSYVAGTTWKERSRLAWDDTDDAVVTQAFEGDFAFKLHLPTLNMWFLERGRRMPHTMNPQERSPAEVEAWLLVELLHRGIDRSAFSTQLPYRFPDLLTGDAEDYDPQSCAAELAELAGWFHNAAFAFVQAAGEVDSAQSPRIDCWPQHLTLTCMLRGHAGTRPVEMGFSPGRAGSDELHFYVAPGDEAETRAATVAMPALTIVAADAPEARLASFLRDAVMQIRR
jgi:hypothetical protein